MILQHSSSLKNPIDPLTGLKIVNQFSLLYGL
jgi:hypothetical protein